jgi:hypothetical protein
MSTYTSERIVPPTPAQTTAPTAFVRDTPLVVNHNAPSKDRYQLAREKVLGNAKTPTPEPTAPVEEQPTITEESKAVEPGISLSPQMAALARKEQKFRQQEQALKAKEKALEDRLTKIAELEALEKKLKAKDYSGLENLVDYNDYTNYIIEKSEKVTPEQEALKKLDAKVEAVTKQQQDNLDKQFKYAVEQRRQEVKALVTSNPEYSAIKELDQSEAVVQHILDTWEHDSVELSPEQAAKEVEEVLLERAKKWSSLSKLKPAEPKTEPEGKQLPPLKPGPVKTLTNSMQATGEIKRPNKSFEHMSDRERWAEARRRAEEKMKKG